MAGNNTRVSHFPATPGLLLHMASARAVRFAVPPAGVPDGGGDMLQTTIASRTQCALCFTLPRAGSANPIHAASLDARARLFSAGYAIPPGMRVCDSHLRAVADGRVDWDARAVRRKRGPGRQSIPCFSPLGGGELLAFAQRLVGELCKELDGTGTSLRRTQKRLDAAVQTAYRLEHVLLTERAERANEVLEAHRRQWDAVADPSVAPSHDFPSEPREGGGQHGAGSAVDAASLHGPAREQHQTTQAAHPADLP